jgi:S-formylglutathione hydrolase FrmB
MWGDPVLFLGVWAQRNPATVLSRLRGVGLYVSSGNGTPGPLDAPDHTTDPFEIATNTNSRAFTTLATLTGLPVTTDFYGNGSHSWAYWGRQLARSWPVLAAGLGLPTS